MQELMRADAAAAIDDDLDDEAPYGDIDTVDVAERAQEARRTRSQVYSIRVPVERLEQLRQLAKDRGVAPTAMLRDWVLRQLDIETTEVPGDAAADARAEHSAAAGNRSSAPAQDARDLEHAVAQLTSALVALPQLLAMFPQLASTLVAQLGAEQRMPASLGTLPGPFESATRAYDAFYGSSIGTPVPVRKLEVPSLSMPARGVGQWPPNADVYPGASTLYAAGYIQRGLGELQATLDGVSNTDQFHDVDFTELYVAADEELSNP